MTEAMPNFEGLLRQALAPVEPPEDLSLRLEAALTSITELAAEELEAWEMSAMRDPRNWARPAAALMVGTSAGVGLVLLRARHRATQRARHGGTWGVAERTLHDLGEEARKLFGER